MPKAQKRGIPPALQNFDALPNSAYVSDEVVAGLYNVSRITPWRWAKAGRLPLPEKVGENTTRWNVGKLRASRAKEAA